MRISHRHIFFILILGLWLAFSVKAEQFLQTQWTTENGLPQNSVTSIAQTPDGYLWIGTFGGLARFGGVRFKIFTTANSPELKSNRITALKTDAQGNLWIGTEHGEVIYYSDSKFKIIDDGETYESKVINDIFIDKDGLVWIAGDGSIRTCWEGKCQSKNFDVGAFTIRQDSEGMIWVAAQDYKLYIFSEGRFIEDKTFIKDVLSIETKNGGGLWVLTLNELFSYQNGKMRSVIVPNKLGSPRFSLRNCPKGGLWFSSGNEVFNIKDDIIKKYELEGVYAHNANMIFIDRDDNVWLGRIGEGLIRLVNQRIQTLTFDGEFEGIKIKNVAVNSLVQDAKGDIWIATNSTLYHLQNGKTVKMSEEFPNVIPGALLFDSEGTIWNATSTGLRSYREGKSVLHEEISWKYSQTANSIFEDKEKNLWYGCLGCGVFVSDKKKIIAKYTKESGLVGNTVSIITQTRDGAMWFGTTSGVSRLKDGVITNWTTENGLSNNYVRDIYEDQDGAIWFGTYGGGLNRLKDEKIKHITTKNGLFDDIVSRILVDDEDNFWMLGNRGIYIVNRKNLNEFADEQIKQIYCNALTAADGMLTDEGNGGYQNAGIRTRDGKFWFPMIKGVVIIDPKQGKLAPPIPIIEEVFLNDKLIENLNKVEINPGNESLEIYYTGLNFRKPEQIRFRYRLEGLDDNWTEAGTRRLANYPYLPSGNYRFQLQAANADGIWSEQIAGFEIEVFPPFWKSWWFIILFAVLVLIIWIAIYEYRNRRFAHEKSVREDFSRRLLQAQENERRKIASEIHDNLGQQLLIIKNWANYCLSKTSKTNKIRGQISQISETANEALETVRAIAKNLSPYHLDKAGLSATIHFMIKQVAESCDIEFVTEIDDVDGYLMKEAEINLYRIVQESVNNIIKHSKANKAKVVLKKERGNLILRITDNGIGFYESDLSYQKFGTGLNGITERARMIGGELTVKSIPQQGTQIILEI